MISRLYRLFAFMLCVCMLFSFAACGEDAPTKADDDITPPVDDTPTADEPEKPSANEPTTDKPEHPTEPSEPGEPTEPDVPTEPEQPDTPAAPEKWSSPEALEILSAYEEVIRGERKMIDTYTQEKTYFSNPGERTFSIWDETHVSIVDFNLDGLPEIIFTTGVFTFDGYDALYSIDGNIYHITFSFRSVGGVYKDHIITCGSGNNCYYDTYELTETGVSINRIATSSGFQVAQNGSVYLIYSYNLYGNEVTEKEFTDWVNDLGEATPPLITYWT